MVCYKDDAATGYVAGRVWPSVALTLRKVTDEQVSSGHVPTNGIETAKVLAVMSVPDMRELVMKNGDMGCGVFHPVPRQGGYGVELVLLLVSSKRSPAGEV